VSSKPADRVEAMLRQADASFEKWFRRTTKQSAGVLRHRVDDLQTALKKLNDGLKQVEQDHKVTLAGDHKVTLAGDHKVAPSKRRTPPTVARKPAAPRKRKKAA
jgi:hypothetical protein